MELTPNFFNVLHLNLFTRLIDFNILQTKAIQVKYRAFDFAYKKIKKYHVYV